MGTGRKLAIGTGAALLAAMTLTPASAQDAKRDRAVDQYLCKDVMRESGPNRDVAIAFLHGFLLGKSGGQAFNLDVLQKESNEFIERCLDNPGEKAVDAMTRVRK